jgi:hypothetical protein
MARIGTHFNLAELHLSHFSNGLFGGSTLLSDDQEFERLYYFNLVWNVLGLLKHYYCE